MAALIFTGRFIFYKEIKTNFDKIIACNIHLKQCIEENDRMHIHTPLRNATQKYLVHYDTLTYFMCT